MCGGMYSLVLCWLLCIVVVSLWYSRCYRQGVATCFGMQPMDLNISYIYSYVHVYLVNTYAVH